ncbi:hypothetical protein [Sphingomonas longa]|nr:MULTISPECIES: hypothetical protein [Alphaproteobacteria]
MTDQDRAKTETPEQPVEQEESGAGYGNNAGEQGGETTKDD